MRDDFGIFIISYSRANALPNRTLKILEEGRYTGKWWIIVGDDDPQLDLYKELWRKRLIIFSKREMLDEVDLCDNFIDDLRSAVFVRNKAWDIAKELGLTYFLVLDDDFSSCVYRYMEGGKLRSAKVNNLEVLCEAMIKFLEVSGAKTVSFGQGGDYLGGGKSRQFSQGFWRRATNSYFCKVDRRFRFAGRLDEDAVAYLIGGITGGLFFSIVPVELVQTTQRGLPGGMTESYQRYSLYTAYFYEVMNVPSAVRIKVDPSKRKGMLRKVSWDACVPCILDEKYKK